MLVFNKDQRYNQYTRMQISEQNQTNNIAGIDMVKGLAMLGGAQDVYRQVLVTFGEDAQERLQSLQTAPDADTLPAFITRVHALKSASASIGAAELSAQALGLETAGKAGDMAFIRENLPVFAKNLAEMIDRIKAWEKIMEERNSEKPADAGGVKNDSIIPLLRELAEALKLQKADDIDEILERITAQPLDTGLKTAVEQISDEVLVAEYDKALAILSGLLK
jgi:HPt (histidine-containing phosphotransfer) domain-containing protein